MKKQYHSIDEKDVEVKLALKQTSKVKKSKAQVDDKEKKVSVKNPPLESKKTDLYEYFQDVQEVTIKQQVDSSIKVSSRGTGLISQKSSLENITERKEEYYLSKQEKECMGLKMSKEKRSFNQKEQSNETGKHSNSIEKLLLDLSLDSQKGEVNNIPTKENPSYSICSGIPPVQVNNGIQPKCFTSYNKASKCVNENFNGTGNVNECFKGREVVVAEEARKENFFGPCLKRKRKTYFSPY